MTAEEILTKAFELRGYGVVASLNQLKIGDIIPGVNSGWDTAFNHPFVVIAITDKEDFDEQCRIVGTPLLTVTGYNFYHRVSTD